MNYQIAIVEDEKQNGDYLEELVIQYSRKNNIEFEITRYSDGAEIAFEYRSQFDIILLDIEMEKMDGLEAAKIIRKSDKDVIIIFVTHLAQYALKGYSVNALSYLLKPVTPFALSHELGRALERLIRKVDDYIFINKENSLVRLNVKDILYIESVGHKTLIKTKKEEYLVPGTIRNMEEQVSKFNFFRCNNGYLVNLAAVTGITDGCALVAEHRLPISRPRKKAFLEALTRYMGIIINS